MISAREPTLCHTPESHIYWRNNSYQQPTPPPGEGTAERNIRSSMWKPNQPGNTPAAPEPVRPTPPAATPAFSSGAAAATPGAIPNSEQATIGKSLVVKGEVSGSNPSTLTAKSKAPSPRRQPRHCRPQRPGSRQHQRSRDRRSRQSPRQLPGLRPRRHPQRRLPHRRRHRPPRISIEDGAFFKGGIDIRKPGNEAKGPVTPATTPEPENKEG